MCTGYAMRRLFVCKISNFWAFMLTVLRKMNVKECNLRCRVAQGSTSLIPNFVWQFWGISLQCLNIMEVHCVHRI